MQIHCYCVFKFRWKKPKDWKNSLKTMMTTEMTQNITGDCFYHAHVEVPAARFCWFFLGFFFCFTCCNSHSQGKCFAEETSRPRKGDRIGRARQEEGEGGARGDQTEAACWGSPWPRCWATEGESTFVSQTKIYPLPTRKTNLSSVVETQCAIVFIEIEAHAVDCVFPGGDFPCLVFGIESVMIWY